MLSYSLPLEGQKRGGIERAAHTLAEGLARRNHDVVVFSHDPEAGGAAYDVRELPWKSFVNTWAGRRLTMGYLGNVLAMVPDYASSMPSSPRRQPAAAVDRKARASRDAWQRARRSAVGDVDRALSASAWRLRTGAADGAGQPRRRRRQREHDARQSVHRTRRFPTVWTKHLSRRGREQDARAVGAVCRRARRPQARPIPARRIRERPSVRRIQTPR